MFAKLLTLLPIPLLAFAALLLPGATGEGDRPRIARPGWPAEMARPADVDRSPSDVAITPDGRFAVVANRGAQTVSLVDLVEKRLVLEQAAPGEAFAVAISPDGKRAAVSIMDTQIVCFYRIEPKYLTVLAARGIGAEPRGLVWSKDGKRLFVALADENAVAVVGNVDDEDLNVRVAKWPVETEPWSVALTPDGKRLAVGNNRGRSVSVLSTTTGKPLHTVNVLGRNLRQMAISPDGKWAYVNAIAERGSPATPQFIDWGWVIGNRLVRVPLQAEGTREALTLDTQGLAVGDAEGLALSPDGTQMAITCGGTHEILLLRFPMPFTDYGGPGDFVDPIFGGDTNRFRRVKLGGRPLGVRFAPDGKSVVVANYFGNSLQVVDFATGNITATIDLGGAKTASLERRGEQIFHDAERSFNQWYSCASCHTEGHTNGGSADTFNDGHYGQAKKTPTLRNVANTAPYTWHGWQTTLDGAVRESMINSMQPRKPPTDDDVRAVSAFLRTLKHPENPNRQNDALMAQAARGADVFKAKACDSCHGGEMFSSPIVAIVGLESKGDVYKGFNPPSLLRIYNRAPYLHDGRASTLEDVLTTYHRPSKLSGKPDCTPTELAMLVAYLNSL